VVPYEEIDCEIRYLVKLLNDFPGIRTEFSCAGHTEDEETYVSFRADSQEHVQAVLAALPFMGARSELVANQFRWRAVCVDVTIGGEGKLRYSLQISGRPQHIQRRLVGEVEQSLAYAVASLQAGRLSCSTYGADRTPNTGSCCSPEQYLLSQTSVDP
jgi:hypothetical protein